MSDARAEKAGMRGPLGPVSSLCVVSSRGPWELQGSLTSYREAQYFAGDR